MQERHLMTSSWISLLDFNGIMPSVCILNMFFVLAIIKCIASYDTKRCRNNQYSEKKEIHVHQNVSSHWSFCNCSEQYATHYNRTFLNFYYITDLPTYVLSPHDIMRFREFSFRFSSLKFSWIKRNYLFAKTSKTKSQSQKKHFSCERSAFCEIT